MRTRAKKIAAEIADQFGISALAEWHPDRKSEPLLSINVQVVAVNKEAVRSASDRKITWAKNSEREIERRAWEAKIKTWATAKAPGWGLSPVPGHDEDAPGWFPISVTVYFHDEGWFKSNPFPPA